MGSLIGFIIMLVDGLIIIAMMEDEKRNLAGILLTVFAVAALVWGIGLDHSEPIKFNGFWISDGEKLEISPEKFPDVTMEDKYPKKITVTLTY